MSKPDTAHEAHITNTPGTRRGITRRDFLCFTGFSAAMAALTGPLSAFAEDANDDNEAQPQSADAPRGEITGTFLHAATYKPNAVLIDGQIEEEFYFNENFFWNSSMLFNPHLSSFAMALNIASCPSNHKDGDKFSNAILFFEELDCEAGVFVVNDDYREAPGTDTIGLVCSHRTIQIPNEDGDYEDCNLVFLGDRGESYSREWASNLKAGESGDHQGFSEASNKAIPFLKAYVKNMQLEGRTKFLFAGFSRGAATLNLTAGRLIDEAIDADASYDEETGYDLSGVFEDQIETYQSDFFVYCFESPAALLVDTDAKRKSAFEDHKNIFNIVNPCDLVPLVMPSKFQFVRYGVDVKMPAPTDGAKWVAAKRKMINCANQLGQSFEPDLVDTFTNVTFMTRWLAVVEDLKHPNPQNMFLVEFFDRLTASFYINSRKKYYSNFQELLRRAYILNNTMSAEPGYKAFTTALSDRLTKIGVIIGLYTVIQSDKTFLAEIALCDHVKEAMRTADSQVKGSKLKDNYYDQWSSVIGQLFTIEFGHYVKYHIADLLIIATKGQDILACHSMGTAMAWTRAMDSRYITGTSPYRPALPDGVEYAPEPDEAAAISE